MNKHNLVIPVLTILLSTAIFAIAGALVPPSVPVYRTSAVPSNGTDCTQAMTFGAGITGGSFALRYRGASTGFIVWSATTETLRARIENALRAISTIGNDGVDVVADGGFSGGHGIMNIGFHGAKTSRLNVPLITIGTNVLTGVTHTLVNEYDEAGVTADGRNSLNGSLCVAEGAGNIYVNQGNPGSPNWVLHSETP